MLLCQVSVKTWRTQREKGRSLSPRIIRRKTDVTGKMTDTHTLPHTMTDFYVFVQTVTWWQAEIKLSGRGIHGIFLHGTVVMYIRHFALMKLALCSDSSPTAQHQSRQGWNTSGLMNRWPFYQGMPQCDPMEVHILQSQPLLLPY